MTNNFLAHVRESDGVQQTVAEHLEGVGRLSGRFASKFGLADCGELIGLLHDLGKYSDRFQSYLKSGTGLLKPGDEGYINAEEHKGKVDHSTAGAQLIWQELSNQGKLGQIVGQILSLCIASHHSGLIDCLTVSPVEDSFTRRINKAEENSHFQEALTKADTSVIQHSKDIILRKSIIEPMILAISSIKALSNGSTTISEFQIGLFVRLLFSCLIDADRTDTADFEKPWAANVRLRGEYISWDILVERLEKKLDLYTTSTRDIDVIRNDISSHCLKSATKGKGLFTLSVPTGGGKTFSSLRFALHHAKQHKMERIFYIIPFTSIIDQNADVVRNVLDKDGEQIILEHHCNLIQDDDIKEKRKRKNKWKDRVLTENWDAPIVFTTMVQFLEACFDSGTRGVRRLHQLANSVIVFDEIQTLPIKCIHMFNNAINLLIEQCGCSVVLCTATQPLLHKVDNKKGAAKNGSEIIPDVQSLFHSLKRVELKDKRKPGCWNAVEIAELAQEQSDNSGSCLVIVNTKRTAKEVYGVLKNTNDTLYHLSTNMCPTHRRAILARVRKHLINKEPVICVSTQLIEAGVDVDFGSVIRCLAGLDSIAQAAGRCNRNGERSVGTVSIINPVPALEKLGSLQDILKGREITRQIIDNYNEDPNKYDNDLIGLRAMEEFYERYFFNRRDEMSYTIEANSKAGKEIGRKCDLLSLLSANKVTVQGYANNNNIPLEYLKQSFTTAAKAFKAISSPTKAVIVSYEQSGNDIINELCSVLELDKQFKLLRRAQQFAVNVFPREFDNLLALGAINPVQEGSDVYCLSNGYYSEEFGLSDERVNEEEFLYFDEEFKYEKRN